MPTLTEHFVKEIITQKHLFDEYKQKKLFTEKNGIVQLHLKIEELKIDNTSKVFFFKDNKFSRKYFKFAFPNVRKINNPSKATVLVTDNSQLIFYPETPLINEMLFNKKSIFSNYEKYKLNTEFVELSKFNNYIVAQSLNIPIITNSHLNILCKEEIIKTNNISSFSKEDVIRVFDMICSTDKEMRELGVNLVTTFPKSSYDDIVLEICKRKNFRYKVNGRFMRTIFNDIKNTYENINL